MPSSMDARHFTDLPARRVSGAGLPKNALTVALRKENAVSMLIAQPISTTTAWCASRAASNTSHFATKPLVSGTPTIAAAAVIQMAVVTGMRE